MMNHINISLIIIFSFLISVLKIKQSKMMGNIATFISVFLLSLLYLIGFSRINNCGQNRTIVYLMILLILTAELIRQYTNSSELYFWLCEGDYESFRKWLLLMVNNRWYHLLLAMIVITIPISLPFGGSLSDPICKETITALLARYAIFKIFLILLLGYPKYS